MKINCRTARQREIDRIQSSKEWQPCFLFWPRRAVAKATQRWVDENPDFFDEAVQEAMKNMKTRTALRKSFARTFNWSLEQAVEARAEALAEEEADKLCNEAKAQLSLASEES